MNRIQNDFNIMWIKDNVFYGHYPREVVVNMEVTHKIFEDRKNLCQGKPYVTMWDCRNIKYWTKEAMNFMSSDEYNKLIKAAAIIYSESLVATIVINFFLSFSKPSVPVRFFTEEEEALNWLKKYM